jgi:hypothetical protein
MEFNTDDIEQENRKVEAMRKELREAIAAHHKETSGRVLTQEDLDYELIMRLTEMFGHVLTQEELDEGAAVHQIAFYGHLLTQEDLDEMEQENRDAEAIRAKVVAHQIETFGHVLTREELDASEEEYRKERMKRFEGLTPDEVIELRQRETDEWTAVMKKNGFDYDDERIYDENLSEEERQEYTARELAAAKKTLHEKIMSSRQQRSDSPRCVKAPAA